MLLDGEILRDIVCTLTRASKTGSVLFIAHKVNQVVAVDNIAEGGGLTGRDILLCSDNDGTMFEFLPGGGRPPTWQKRARGEFC